MKKIKRAMCMLISVILMISCVNMVYAADGTFTLAVAKGGNVLIEPVQISYTAGQSVADALAESGYTFDGLETGYVSAIEGKAGNFVRFYDDGGYDLEKAASGITALVFTENENYSQALLQLVKSMSAYRARTDHVQNYAPAEEAYDAALKGFGTADEATATQLKTNLDQAIKAYEALLKGTKYTVTVAATQDGTKLTAPTITMTDSYGNVTTAKGTTLSVIAGSYTYAVSDGGRNRTEGTVEVKGKMTVSVQLPYGQWFGDVQILDADKKAYPCTQDHTALKATYTIPDTVGTSGLYLCANIGNVPDQNTTRLRTIYSAVNSGMPYDTANDRSWNSQNTKLSNLLKNGMDGRTFYLEAQYPVADGTTQIQSFEMAVNRVPTLQSLAVTADGTRLPISFDPETISYQVTTVSDTVQVSASAFGADYAVSGTGNVSVGGRTSHTVKVTAEGTSRSYMLTFIKKEAVNVTLETPSGVTASVYNEAGAQIAPVSGEYHLIPGEQYTYIAVKNSNYFTSAVFTASAGLSVSVASPITTEALQAAAFYSNSTATKPYTSSQSGHTITCQVTDANSTVYAQATPTDGYSVQARYMTQTTSTNTHGNSNSKDITRTVGAANATVMNYCLARGGYGNAVTLYVSKIDGGVTYYQTYTVQLCRALHLDSLQLSDSGSQLTVTDSAGNHTFDRDKTDYTVSVDREEAELKLKATFMNELTDTSVCGGYYALVNGVRYDSLADVTLPLDTEKGTETISIQVCHADSHAVPVNYTVTVKKTNPVAVTFKTDPADANVFVINEQNGRRAPQSNGIYQLTPGVNYTYTVTRNGYVGQQVTGYQVPSNATTLTITMEKAAENSGLQDLNAQWPSFRADDCNNGVVNAATPTAPENAGLSWATKLGDGYSADACGCPIIVDGYLYTYARNEIFKVDTVSGEVVVKGTMDHSSSFAINSPTYADGMIFVGLADGTVQAFNAATLQSLWIYHDALKGQPNCPIVYHDGYIYTGFWLGETTPANYVCLSVTDENPDSDSEEKLATWTYTQKGGFYWAGAYVSDDYLVVGTDDGESGYTTGHARILSLDPMSGEVLDQQTLPQVGDQRSSVTFVPNAADANSGKCYFTTKGGNFYEIAINANGRFTAGSLRDLPLYNYSNDTSNPPMSTCTPTIYNGRAYIGVSGTAQFGAYSGHNITVIDIPSWSIAYTVRTHGYPQTSGLLTTAYEAETGYVNVYFFDNFTPGELRMIRDKRGMTKPEITEAESYTDKGSTKTYQTAPVLFTPYGEQAQYAICSPIVDEYGTIYFKNDSAYLMALSSTITKLEITKMPDKTAYAEGESFDGTGMQVIAHYSNGARRDVTQYVAWSEEPLTRADTEFTIAFPYAMYQNADGKAGHDIEQPFAVLSLTVSEGAAQKGDVDGDGCVNSADATLTYAIANGKLAATDTQREVADVNNDGKVDSSDGSLIYAYANGYITSFSQK